MTDLVPVAPAQPHRRDLVDFLRARLNETEAQAREDDCVHLAPGWTAHILAQVEATRAAFLTRGQGVCNCDGYDSPPTDPSTRQSIPHHYDCAAYEAARLFGQVYADHPDFDPAWRTA